MKKLFEDVTIWELTSVAWWPTVIVLFIVLGFHMLVIKPLVRLYRFLLNLYFFKYELPKKDEKWFQKTVDNFERWTKNVEDWEKFNKKHWLTVKYYNYCKQRLSDEKR